MWVCSQRSTASTAVAGVAGTLFDVGAELRELCDHLVVLLLVGLIGGIGVQSHQ